MLSQNNNALGIIFPNSYDTTVPELVTERAMASIPFAGRYRMVDFVLSSMANCGISNVSIVVRKNYHSLMDHLGTGAALGRLCSQCAAVVGVVGTGTCDDGHPVVDGINGELDGSQLLFIGHGGALTGGSADDDGIGAARDLVFDDAAQFVKVDAAILVHRGDDRYARAGKDRIFHSVRSPFAVFGNADQSK